MGSVPWQQQNQQSEKVEFMCAKFLSDNEELNKQSFVVWNLVVNKIEESLIISLWSLS